jgi:hypothetical protein
MRCTTLVPFTGAAAPVNGKPAQDPGAEKPRASIDKIESDRFVLVATRTAPSKAPKDSPVSCR